MSAGLDGPTGAAPPIPAYAEPGVDTPTARRFVGLRGLVTGAGGGIGRAVALRMAAEGGEVIAADVDLRAAEATARALPVDPNASAAYGRISAVRLDVRDAESVRTLAADVAADRLDVLVNNAGIEILGDIEETDPQSWDEVMAINLRGPYLVSRALLPALRRSVTARGEATVVHNASMMGLVSSARLAAYCASKAGLVSLTRSMALDHAAEGIRVNCVCPGIIHTSMLERRFDLEPDRDQAYANNAARPPLGYLGRPQDVAAAICYLAAPESRFVTGAALQIDGGVGAA
jgi:NAD(P)-dependent dehydrogenase (short-subunit alcohol dehydrogenase family)